MCNAKVAMNNAKIALNRIQDELMPLLERGQELLNSDNIFQDFFSDIKAMNDNDLYLIFIANQCENLESIDITSLKNVSSKALEILCEKRKDSLKSFKINNYRADNRDHEWSFRPKQETVIEHESLEKLHLLEELVINHDTASDEAISQLKNLKKLSISYKKYNGFWFWMDQRRFLHNHKRILRTVMQPLFENKNLEHLEELEIKESQEVVDDDLLEILALNCPKLKRLLVEHRNWSRGKITLKGLEFFLMRLPKLSVLSISWFHCNREIESFFNKENIQDVDLEYSSEAKIIAFCCKQQQKRIKWNLKTKTVVTEVMNSVEDTKPNFCAETC